MPSTAFTLSEKEKTITVAANGSFYPVIYTDDNGKLTGFEHDIMEEIGNRAGYKIDFKVVGDYSAMMAGVDSGKYDTIAGQVSVTDERKKIKYIAAIIRNSINDVYIRHINKEKARKEILSRKEVVVKPIRNVEYIKKSEVGKRNDMFNDMW